MTPERLDQIDEDIALSRQIHGDDPDDNPLLALAAYDLRDEVEALRARIQEASGILRAVRNRTPAMRAVLEVLGGQEG